MSPKEPQGAAGSGKESQGAEMNRKKFLEIETN
jgi:hypothetical protein